MPRFLPFMMDDLVWSGEARAVLPTTDTGYKTYGAGRLFLPAGTNYCTNPSFETDTDSDGMADAITCAPANATVTKSIATRMIDGKSVKVQIIRVVGAAGVGVTTGADFETTAVASFALNDYATASVYLKVTELVGCTLRVQIVSRNAAGSAVATTSSSAISAVDADFVRRSLTAQLTHADTSRASVKINTGANFGEGDSFTVEIAMAMLEKSAVLTPYFDGSYPDCAWTGTANASTSTRTVSALTVPIALGSTGFTIGVRFSPLWVANNSLAQPLLTLKAAADVRATLYKHTDNKVAASVTDGIDTVVSASAAQTFAIGTLNSVVMRSTWASTVDLTLNGTAATQGNAAAVEAQTITAVQFDTGAAYEGPSFLSPSRITDAETVLLNAGLTAGWQGIDVFRFFRDRGYTGTLILPLVSDSVGYVVV